MDKKQRHCSVSGSSCLADHSRYPLHHTRCRSESLTDLPNDIPESRQISLVRVKGQDLTMQTPPKKSEMVWANDQSPSKSPSKRTPGRPGTPGTPGTPRRAGTPEAGSTLVNPSSVLLQDLLKEQRACRGSRAATEEMDAQVPRTPDRPSARSRSLSQSQSQDDTSEKQKRVNSALSAGLRQPREMGVREMDHYVSKMNKQNFDLKLEIFHRTQQVSALEKRLERLEELEEEVKRIRALEDELQELRHAEEDNQRLRESNEQLRQELDKRDQAVTEAVDLICQLEAKVAELEATNPSRPSTAPSEGPDVATPKQSAFIDIPERATSKQGTNFDQHRNASPERPHLQSAPSFLRDENRTPALRGLYLPGGNQSQSAMSVITKSESLNSMNENAEPASPRLSALSECSDLIPEEVSVLQEEADQPEIASRGEESEAGSSDTFGRKFQIRSQERKRAHIDQWIRPVPGAYSNQNGSPRQKKRSNDSMDPRQRVRMDGLFGSSRLPPTPDTMSTAPRNNRSNGSIQAGKYRKQQLGRPRSFDELTSRRSSDNSARTGSMGTNMSDTSTREMQGIEKHETPAITPLNSISTKHRRHVSCQESTTSWDDTGHHGESDSKSKRHTVNLPSSPQLTPQDWVEAANPIPAEKAGYQKPSKYYQNSVSMGARHPGKASLDVRRHSMDSAIRRSTTEPTLDPHSLEFAPHPAVRPPAPVPEPTRRRISFRPPFFNLFGNSRRLQQSATQDSRSSEEHAPAPVVPKARNSGVKSTPKLLEYRPASSRAELGPLVPTYADPAQRALVHSSTESNILSNTTRPITSNSKEHKRRSSLSIIGWMKGATGKKSEPNSPITLTQSNNAVRSRRSSLRMNPDIPDAAKDMAANTSTQAFAGSPNPDEAGRRLRYIERRGHRGSLR